MRIEESRFTISVVILTFNSEAVIADTLAAAGRVSDDIHLVDSYSHDTTVDIAETAGARIKQRRFANYAEQRNWAIANLPLRHGWQLHLDADEILTESLIDEINGIAGQWPEGIDGFYIPRLTRFLGRELRHGGHYPIYHMRLFRAGCGRVENRKYDQHFVLDGRGQILRSPFIDDHRTSLAEWTQRHNQWSDFLVDDNAGPQPEIQPNLFGNPLQRRRVWKGVYGRAPLFLRAGLLFFYKFVLRGGFRDGMPGLIFHFLQSFWFRFLVDAKLYEREIMKRDSQCT